MRSGTDDSEVFSVVGMVGSEAEQKRRNVSDYRNRLKKLIQSEGCAAKKKRKKAAMCGVFCGESFTISNIVLNEWCIREEPIHPLTM